MSDTPVLQWDGSRRLSAFPLGCDQLLGVLLHMAEFWGGSASCKCTGGSRHHHLLLFQLSIAVCLGFLAAWTPYAVVALWAVLGDASQVPALAFVLSAVFAKSSTLYNPLVYLLFKPNFHKFLSKDVLLLQAMRTLLCCGCPSAALQPFPPPGFRDRPGACRSCNDTFECFSNYPKCHKPARAPGSSPRCVPLAMLADGAACPPRLKRTVQVMVLVTRRRSGLSAVNVVGEALPSNIMKDLL